MGAKKGFGRKKEFAEICGKIKKVLKNCQFFTFISCKIKHCFATKNPLII